VLKTCSLAVCQVQFFRDGAESKISPESDSPEKEDLYRLHKSGDTEWTIWQMRSDGLICTDGDRHPRAIDAEEGDVDQLQDAKSEKQNP